MLGKDTLIDIAFWNFCIRKCFFLKIVTVSTHSVVIYSASHSCCNSGHSVARTTTTENTLSLCNLQTSRET